MGGGCQRFGGAGVGECRRWGAAVGGGMSEVGGRHGWGRAMGGGVLEVGESWGGGVSAVEASMQSFGG